MNGLLYPGYRVVLPKHRALMSHMSEHRRLKMEQERRHQQDLEEADAVIRAGSGRETPPLMNMDPNVFASGPGGCGTPALMTVVLTAAFGGIVAQRSRIARKS